MGYISWLCHSNFCSTHEAKDTSKFLHIYQGTMNRRYVYIQLNTNTVCRSMTTELFTGFQL